MSFTLPLMFSDFMLQFHSSHSQFCNVCLIFCPSLSQTLLPSFFFLLFNCFSHFFIVNVVLHVFRTSRFNTWKNLFSEIVWFFSQGLKNARVVGFTSSSNSVRTPLSAHNVYRDDSNSPCTHSTRSANWYWSLSFRWLAEALQTYLPSDLLM